MIEMDHIEAPSDTVETSAAAPFKPGDPLPEPPERPPAAAQERPRSPDTFLETLAGDPGLAVEELTVKNYMTPNASPSGPAGRSPWLNFTRLGTAELSLNGENRGSDVGTSTPGVRTKMLPAAGFPQFMVKRSLKGKGVAYRHQESQEDKSSFSISVRKWGREMVSERPEAKSLYGAGDGPEGISLREWLRHRQGKLSKVERMYVLRQIVELIDILHSHGIALQSIRPSQFQILAVDQVRYVGSFIRDGLEMRDNDGLEESLKRKRYMEQDNQIVVPQSFQSSGGFGGDVIKEMDQSMFKTRSCDNDQRKQLVGESWYAGKRPKAYVESGSGDQLPAADILKLEEGWYASPEEINENACSLSSNIYNLGVLAFELFCCFETWKVHSTAMSDLRHRILPPNFLSESPKEASFCLWLLHPEPSSRPNSRDILTCDLVSEGRDLSSLDHLSGSIDAQDAEADLLLHFLLTLKEQKEKQAAKLVSDLGCLQADAEEVERRQSSRVKFLSSAKYLGNDSVSISETCFQRGQIQVETTPIVPMSSTNDDRFIRNINQLEEAYFSVRSKIELSETNDVARQDKDVLMIRDSCSQVQKDVESGKESTDRLGTFYEGLCKYARYSRFEVCGSLRNVDILNSANVICSLSFDRDEEYFAAAGVSKKIKIFEFSSLLNDSVDIHYPLIEMSSRSKLSCVCWNSYIKNYLASTDYEGVVQLWDASTGQGFMQYREHQKRAWSVDFSPTDPMKLASGSDDCFVKLWNINEKNATNSIRTLANVCCVQFSSYSSHFVACGSADYKIYCYDLRNTRSPWCVLGGHGKAVSYVKFVDSETVVSASTDNTLKLWDLNKTNTGALSKDACSLTLRGHTNEKNFVGLSVSNGYIACGSETNEVYAYYKTFPMPVTSHKFGSIDSITGQETSDDNGQFVSSVCWRSKSNMVVTANSSGSIKLLQLV